LQNRSCPFFNAATAPWQPNWSEELTSWDLPL
jgi:hypothetical protein